MMVADPDMDVASTDLYSLNVELLKQVRAVKNLDR